MTKAETKIAQGATEAMIARLEAATEGSRELNADIYFAVYGAPSPNSPHPVPYPRYTESIDAARSLFSEDVVSWKICDSPGGPTAWVLLADGREYEGFPEPGKGTPATAACIAALLAWLHETEEG